MSSGSAPLSALKSQSFIVLYFYLFVGRWMTFLAQQAPTAAQNVRNYRPPHFTGQSEMLVVRHLYVFSGTLRREVSKNETLRAPNLMHFKR